MQTPLVIEHKNGLCDHMCMFFTREISPEHARLTVAAECMLFSMPLIGAYPENKEPGFYRCDQCLKCCGYA